MSLFATNALQGIQRKKVWAQWTWKNIRCLLVAMPQSDVYSRHLIQSSNSTITAVNPRTSKSQHLSGFRPIACKQFLLIARIHTSFCPPDTIISLLEGNLALTAAHCNDHTHHIHYHHQHIWDPTTPRNFWWLLKMTRDPIKHDMVFRSS